jgi:8-oxo-dGTP pyrophosphatase MutT (NUDIX family)
MTWKPELTVAAVVAQSGKFLIVEERVGRRLVFNQPAGHVEEGESLLDAVVRETLEETASILVPDAVVGIYLWKNPQTGRSYLRVAFTGSLTMHDPDRALDHGIVRTHWLSREQLLGHQNRLRSPLVLRCVDDWLAGTRFPLALLSHLPADAIEKRAAVV